MATPTRTDRMFKDAKKRLLLKAAEAVVEAKDRVARFERLHAWAKHNYSAIGIAHKDLLLEARAEMELRSGELVALQQAFSADVEPEENPITIGGCLTPHFGEEGGVLNHGQWAKYTRLLETVAEKAEAIVPGGGHYQIDGFGNLGPLLEALRELHSFRSLTDAAEKARRIKNTTTRR